MRYSVRSRAFLVGFFVALLVFAGLNVVVYLGSQCYHCVENTGFPLVFRQRFAGAPEFSSGSLTFPNDIDSFSVWRLIANLLIVFFSSVGFATIFDLTIARLRKVNSVVNTTL
jgi:fucose permease